LPWEERKKVGPILLRITAISKQKKKVNVKVSFIEKGDAGSSNMKLPFSYFKEHFTDPETKCLGHLVKIDPTRPWGEIEMKVEVIEKEPV
jgi:hypothetical protein